MQNHSINLNFESAENILDNAAASDLVIVTKVDIADSNQLDELKQDLNEVAQGVETIDARFANLPVDLLFELRKNSSRSSPSTDNSTISNELLHHGYREITLELDHSVSREDFDVFTTNISRFAWRSKGFVAFKENPDQRFLFNLVGKRATLEKTYIEIDSSAPLISLVVIGKSTEMPENLVL